MGRFSRAAEVSGGGPFLTARVQIAALVRNSVFRMVANVPCLKFSTYSGTRLLPVAVGPFGLGRRALIPLALRTNSRLLSLMTFVGYQPVGTRYNSLPVVRLSTATALVPARVM